MSIDPSSLRVGFLAGTLGRGGAERQLIYMLRALQNVGIKSRVLCLTKGEALEEEIMNLGIDVDWVGRSGNRPLRLISIIENFRRNPVDVIHSSHFYTNTYAGLAGRTLRVASIGAIRNDLESEISANGVFGRWHLKLPQFLIANSMMASEKAVAAGVDGSRIHLVRNAVEEQSDRRPSGKGNKVNLLFAGRLVPQKRPELFIRLASELRGRHPKMDLRFLISGDGPLRALLEQQVKNYGFVHDEVTFLGEQTIMSDVYRQSDILVLTSRHEGTPNVVLEAMVNGLAVVATRVGGVPEIINDDCGFVVDPFDFSALVEATSTLIADPEKRIKIGANGNTIIRKTHSISRLQKELTEVYSRIN